MRSPVLLSLTLCPLLLAQSVCDRRQTKPPPDGPVKTAPAPATPPPQVTPPPQPEADEATADAEAPPLLSRQAWEAKEPVAEMKRHEPVRITVHHTATAQKPDTPLERKMRGLQNFSQQSAPLAGGGTKPAWPDVPYHFYVDVHGRIAEGRNIVYAGDTNTDYDPTGHILVVVEGNFETERPTAEQLRELNKLLRWLSARWRIPAAEIKGHGDYASTACPGKNLEGELPRLREGAAGKGEQP